MLKYVLYTLFHTDHLNNNNNNILLALSASGTTSGLAHGHATCKGPIWGPFLRRVLFLRFNSIPCSEKPYSWGLIICISLKFLIILSLSLHFVRSNEQRSLYQGLRDSAEMSFCLPPSPCFPVPQFSATHCPVPWCPGECAFSLPPYNHH